jgi:NADP-dependent 3-hydroxy acid dehydrogenase YdfG
MTEEKRFLNKVAVITGASSGIGMATARRLVASGATVVLHGRRKERLQQLSEELGGAAWIAGDLTQAGAVEQLLVLASTRHGRIDYALNNAGINHTGCIAEIDVDKLCAMARINVEAAFRFTYVFLKYFANQNSGHLVHTTSVMGHKVRETAGGYAGTKHAIEACCEALRIELAGSPIKVTCVAPGLVKTELHRDLAVHPSVSRKIQRPLRPEDVADAIAWALAQPPHVNIPQLVILPQDHSI